MSAVALIPARTGSKRIVGKNLRLLGGHPLLAYTVVAACRSGAFDRVVVSTEDHVTADVARSYGAEVPFLRPRDLALDSSPDIDWVRHAIDELRAAGSDLEIFAILRPTSPLRRPETIRAAVAALRADDSADSIRAVERVTQHPAKMWTLTPAGDRMLPLLNDGGAQPPWHSTPYQGLPPVYVQNASLEVARVRALDEHGTIAGRTIRPLITEELDGFDLNEERDWTLLAALLAGGSADLPRLDPFPLPPAMEAP